MANGSSGEHLHSVYPVILVEKDTFVPDVRRDVFVTASRYGYALIVPLPEGDRLDQLTDDEFDRTIAGPVLEAYPDYCEVYRKRFQEELRLELPPTQQKQRLCYETQELEGFVAPTDDGTDDGSDVTEVELFLMVLPAESTMYDFLAAHSVTQLN